MIGNFGSKVVGCLARPHYIFRFAVELVLAVVYICVLSCDDFRALGISKNSCAVLVVGTYAFIVYSLLQGKKDEPFRLLFLLAAGRCILVIIVDSILLFLSYVAVLRTLANGPEFFSDDLSMPESVEYSDIQSGVVNSFYGDMVPTNCSPHIFLTANYPQICYGAVNPGEPGKLRIRVYEVTTGALVRDTSLLDAILEEDDPDRYVSGWSKEDGECFTFKRDCHIPNGRKDKPYVVSVELWFLPESREPMRRLISRNFLVRGRY